MIEKKQQWKTNRKTFFFKQKKKNRYIFCLSSGWFFLSYMSHTHRKCEKRKYKFKNWNKLYNPETVTTISHIWKRRTLVKKRKFDQFWFCWFLAEKKILSRNQKDIMIKSKLISNYYIHYIPIALLRWNQTFEKNMIDMFSREFCAC